MTELGWAVAALTVVVTLLALDLLGIPVIEPIRARLRPKPKALRAVWVTTQDSQTIRGVMVYEGRDRIMLRAAQLGAIDPVRGLVWTKMQGDVVIPGANVAYFQDAVDPAFLDE